MTNPTPIPNAEFSLEEMDGEILLYSTANTRTIYLNQSAAIIWQLCDGDRTMTDIIEILSEAFPDIENMHQDVANCLNQLSSDGAISINA
ncbi:MAG: PqqD family peptide modification chaperone [Acidiferrobacterales bacterium]|nr:PqqD family peptide modification chaperone [Acidiferrobacterales bacterium]